MQIVKSERRTGMLRLGGELCLGNTSGMGGRGEVRALGLVKSQGPFAIIALDRDFYGLELNEPGNSGRCLFFSALSKMLLMPQVLFSEQ